MQEPTPESYSPQLSLWGHAWRTVLCIAISCFVWFEIADVQWDEAQGLFWLDLALGLVSFGLMFLRRRWPLTIAVLLTLFGFLSATSSGPGTLATVSLATRRVYWQIVLVGALGLAGSQFFTRIEPQTTNDRWWIGFTVALAFTIATMAWGMYLGSRRELIWTLRERASSAERQQELRLAQARSLERERIAREMHDVLAHRISLVTMHAGALAYRTDLPPEQVRETAAIIQAKAHEALTDLREVLGFLREDHQPNRPQPTLADLPELVQEAVASGMTVELTNSLTGTDAVPDGVGRTVYRIVQEGLTNARKHATGTHVEVAVTGARGDGVEVRLCNPIRLGTWAKTPGAGLGLVGLRERAELAGGTLDVTDDQRTFALRWVAAVAGMIRVLIVDDDALVRSGLALILGGAPDLDVVAQAGNGREGLDAASEHHPDVVLMDIRMPVMDGIEATANLLEQPEPPKVIVLTTFGADDYVVRALGAGASGFLLKDTSPPDIVDAVRKVADGDPMLSPAVTNSLIQQITSQRSPERADAAQSRLALLTEREHDVAIAVGRGLSNAEIAGELYLSIPTVKAHIGRLFAKLEVDNRVQIALCVHDAGLT